MISIALVLGGAACLKSDIEAYDGPFDAVIACNDAASWYDGDLDALVSIHPEHFKHWLAMRTGPSPARLVCHTQWDGAECVPFAFPGTNPMLTGSSGLFAAKYALVDRGFDKVVLAGIPMDRESGHFFDPRPWESADGFRKVWLSTPQHYLDRMRSLSGWTRTLLGRPEWNSMSMRSISKTG